MNSRRAISSSSASVFGVAAVRAQVVADAVAQRPRLADVDRVAGRVEVQVDPGLLGQPGDLILEFADGHTLLCRVSCACLNPPLYLCRRTPKSCLSAVIRRAQRAVRRRAPRMTFTGIIGAICWLPLRAIIATCVALRIHPNVLTLVGVVINVGGRWALGVPALRACRAS